LRLETLKVGSDSVDPGTISGGQERGALVSRHPWDGIDTEGIWSSIVFIDKLSKRSIEKVD
jgi:hypothetical protein